MCKNGWGGKKTSELYNRNGTGCGVLLSWSHPWRRQHGEIPQDGRRSIAICRGVAQGEQRCSRSLPCSTSCFEATAICISFSWLGWVVIVTRSVWFVQKPSCLWIDEVSSWQDPEGLVLQSSHQQGPLQQRQVTVYLHCGSHLLELVTSCKVKNNNKPAVLVWLWLQHPWGGAAAAGLRGGSETRGVSAACCRSGRSKWLGQAAQRWSPCKEIDLSCVCM